MTMFFIFVFGSNNFKNGWFFYQLPQFLRFNNMHIKLARITALCYLIKEKDQMKVGISANNEAKVQLATY